MRFNVPYSIYCQELGTLVKTYVSQKGEKKKFLAKSAIFFTNAIKKFGEKCFLTHINNNFRISNTPTSTSTPLWTGLYQCIHDNCRTFRFSLVNQIAETSFQFECTISGTINIYFIIYKHLN